MSPRKRAENKTEAKDQFPVDLDPRMKTYDALDRFQRDVLDVLAVLYMPLGVKKITEIVNALDVRDPNGKAASTGSVTAALKGLASQGLVQEATGGRFCDRKVVELIARRMVAEGRFGRVAAEVYVAISPVTRWSSRYDLTSIDHVVALIRIALYTKDFEQVEIVIDQALDEGILDSSGFHPISEVIKNPFDPEWLSTYPLEEQGAWSCLLLIDLLKAGGKSDEAVAFARQVIHHLDPDLRLNLAFVLAETSFYQGRFEEALEIAREELGYLADLIQARYFLATGAAKESVALYESCLDEIKKLTRKKKPKFPTSDWVYFILALMDAGKEYWPRALELAEWAVNDRSYFYRDICGHLASVVRIETGTAVNATSTYGNYWRMDAWLHESSVAMKLLHLLADIWQERDSIERDGAALAALVETVRTGGFHWFEHEFVSVLGTAEKSDKKHADRAAELRATLGVRPLFQIVRRLEEWERVLNALEQVTRGDQGEVAGKKASRLVWVLTFEYGECTIEAKEQKCSSNGRWTKGRVVSLQRLREEGRSLGFLTPHDLRVCECILVQSGGGYWHRSYETYYVSIEALAALAGHPNVYRSDTGDQLEVVAATPELRVTHSKDGYALEVLPGVPTAGRIRYELEGDTRLVVYEYTMEIERVAAILGDGVTIPERGKDEVQDAVARLSSLVTVHSDVSVGNESIPTVAADASPIVQLLPAGEGLLVQLRVRPLPDGGPLFPPALGGEVVMAEVNGARLQANRDFHEERVRSEAVMAACPALAAAEAGDGEWRLETPEEALEFLVELNACDPAPRIQWPKGEKYAIRGAAGLGQFRMNVKGGQNWFDVSGEVRVDQELVLDMQRLLALTANSRSRFVDLGDGQFLALTHAFRKKLDELRGVGDERDGALRLHALAGHLMDDFVAEAASFKANKQWKDQVRRLEKARDLDPEVPTTLRATLRDYQVEGFKWLARLAEWGVGACLADDMGLGKTVQILALMLHRASGGPQLVVAPTSVCANWEDEALRFAPTLRVHRFGAGNREEIVADLGAYDVIVCSYGLLQSERALFKSTPWHTIVLDEAQAIKNLATKRSKAAMDLEGAFRIIATGTPIENHLGELWNLYRFINPGFLGSLEQFNTKFALPIEKHENRDAGRHLKQLIQPFILRRCKEDVLDELPARTDIVLHVELGKEERAFYEALRLRALEQLSGVEAAPGRHHGRILAEIMRLRRACCNSKLVDESSLLSSAKLEVFEAVLDDLMENRHKALVFSQFVDHLRILRELLDRKGVSYQYLDGSTPAKARKEAVDAFQAGKGDVFLISLKAGGLGLNLTAADYVIHMDPWWNPAVEDQASDRAHRIGQRRPVTVYRLVAKDTIEDQITALHHRKRDLADSLLEGADLAGKISAEELLSLLREK